MLHCSGSDQSGPSQLSSSNIARSIPIRDQCIGKSRELPKTEPLAAGFFSQNTKLDRVSTTVNHNGEDTIMEVRDMKACSGNGIVARIHLFAQTFFPPSYLRILGNEPEFFFLKSFGIFLGGGIQVCPSNYDEREKEHGK